MTYPHGPYHVGFHARGNYVPVLQWTSGEWCVAAGEYFGGERGAARRGTTGGRVSVCGGCAGRRASHGRRCEKKVCDQSGRGADGGVEGLPALPAHVNANRIEGSVEVSNATVDDLDLTFDVKAVAEDGQATEIGYQRFPLTEGDDWNGTAVRRNAAAWGLCGVCQREWRGGEAERNL